MNLVFIALLVGTVIGALTTCGRMASRVRTLEAGITEAVAAIDEAFEACATAYVPADAKGGTRETDEWLDCGIPVVDPDGRTMGTALLRPPSLN